MVEGVARADVKSQRGHELPVILYEVFLDVIAGADFAGLQVDSEVVDLSEKETGKGAAGASGSLLVGAGGSEGESSGGIGRGDGVELIASEIGTELDGVLATRD